MDSDNISFSNYFNIDNSDMSSDVKAQETDGFASGLSSKAQNSKDDLLKLIQFQQNSLKQLLSPSALKKVLESWEKLSPEKQSQLMSQMTQFKPQAGKPESTLFSFLQAQLEAEKPQQFFIRPQETLTQQAESKLEIPLKPDLPQVAKPELELPPKLDINIKQAFEQVVNSAQKLTPEEQTRMARSFEQVTQSRPDSGKPEPGKPEANRPESVQTQQNKPAQASDASKPSNVEKLPIQPKINTPNSPPKIDAEAVKITDAQIIYILNKLKIPITQENIQIARVMLGFGIMVQLNTMAKLWRILAHMQSVPENNQLNIYSACFLEKSKLPVTTENINTMTNFIINKPHLANQLAEIHQGFQMVMLRDGIRDIPQVMRLFNHLNRIIQEMIISPQMQDQQKIAESLFKMAQQVGIEKEFALGKQVDFEKLAQILNQMADKFQGTPAEKALLIKTADLFSQVSQNLSAQKLINEASVNRTDLTYFYWQVPVQSDGNYLPADLRLSYQPYQLRIDPENVRVDFAIKTKNLGKMHFVLDINNNIVRGKILVEDDKTMYLVNKSLDKFKGELVKLFYQIHFVDCVVSEPPPIIWELGFDQIDVNRVNLKA